MKRKILFTIIALAIVTLVLSLNVYATEVELNVDEDSWIKDYITPSFVTSLVSLITLVVATIKLIASNMHLKKEKTMTVEEASAQFEKVLNEKFDNFIKENTEKVANSMIEVKNQNSNVLKSFAKVLALSQENTPTAKLAILDLISQMNILDDDVVEGAKKVIEEEIKEDEAKEVENAETLNLIIKPVE